MLAKTAADKAAALAGALGRLQNRLERSPNLPDLELAEALVLLNRLGRKVDKCLAGLEAAAAQLPFTNPPAANGKAGGTGGRRATQP